MKHLRNIIFAGTFDHLHIGHRKMLDIAFKLADKVSIGITSQKMYQSKPLSQLILSYDQRRQLVRKYLQERNWLKRADFFQLNDVYGPSIDEGKYDGILVTEETKKNAVRINSVRKSKDLPELKIVTAPLVLSSDGVQVTSERIRMGEIDSNGKRYELTDKKLKKQLIMPDSLRDELRKPLGEVMDGLEIDLEKTARALIDSFKKTKYTMVICVGDIVSLSLLKLGFEPDVKIVDLRSRRKLVDELKVFKKKKPRHVDFSQVVNKPGTIEINASHLIEKSIQRFVANRKKQTIVVNGEEDLLALPAILLAPLGSCILYGQWNLGVIAVEVTEEKKKHVQRILKKFN